MFIAACEVYEHINFTSSDYVADVLEKKKKNIILLISFFLGIIFFVNQPLSNYLHLVSFTVSSVCMYRVCMCDTQYLLADYKIYLRIYECVDFFLLLVPLNNYLRSYEQYVSTAHT